MNQLHSRNPLWLKESGSYVDIFSSTFHGNDIDNVKSEIDDLVNNRQKKDNGKAAQFRLEGNKFFSQGKYHLALEKYNQSMCYAENDTDVMALAYSNRSSCYLKLKLFKKCLNDIEIARLCSYPVDLSHKLDSREAECLQELSNGNFECTSVDNQIVSLSYDEHTKYAGVADCLELQHNSEWGRHITTTRNLNINETIMIESPFAFVGHDCNDCSSKYNRCSHCYKSLMNFVPCKECVHSMFCDNECLDSANESRHKLECQLKKMDSDNRGCKEKEFELVLEMLRKINVTFDTVEELIRTIESIVPGDSIRTDSDARTDDKMKKLAMILQLETNKHKQDSSDLQRMVQSTLRNYFVVTRLPEFQKKFVSEEHLRFLQHLILHLVHIAKQSVLFSDLNVDVNTFREAELRDYGIGLYPIGSQLNHSCVPNVYCYSVDNRLICKIIRPIEVGEQLFRSYMGGQMIIYEDDPIMESTYGFLRTQYKIDECKCSYCAGRRSSQSYADPWFETRCPNYQIVRAVHADKIVNFFRMSDSERQSYVDKAIAYLIKYETIHPIYEKFVMQMYLQNYWMLTTAQGN